MSHKSKTELTPEERKKKELEKQAAETEAYMKGRPSRVEVANYVNSILEEKYMPEILNQIETSQRAMQLGLMVLQSILINKNIAKPEEIEKITTEYVEKFKRDLKSQENPDEPETTE